MESGPALNSRYASGIFGLFNSTRYWIHSIEVARNHMQRSAMPKIEAIKHVHGVELPERYYIAKVDAAVAEWCKALLIYGFMLRTSIWTPILREPKTANALRALKLLSDYFDHAINSGLSYGIFDKEYQPRRSESVNSGGGDLNWDELDPDDPYLSIKMIENMDFPLVSVALSYDFFNQRKADFEPSILKILPLHPSVMELLGKGAPGPSDPRWPRKYGEVVCRTGTVTKPGYEGRGLMTALNKFVMLEMKSQRYRNLIIGTAGNGMSVHHVYTNPPEGCTSQILHHYDVEAMELKDEHGRAIRPYVGCDLKEGWMVWVTF